MWQQKRQIKALKGKQTGQRSVESVLLPVISNLHYCAVICYMLDRVKFLWKSAITVCAGFVKQLQ